MNPESNDHKTLLLDALLHEQKRTDREQAIKAIEDAIAASATTTVATEKRKQRWPWAVGLAASAVLSAAVLNERGVFRKDDPIIAYHHVSESEHREKGIDIERVIEENVDLQKSLHPELLQTPPPAGAKPIAKETPVTPLLSDNRPAPSKDPSKYAYFDKDADKNANVIGAAAPPVVTAPTEELEVRQLESLKAQGGLSVPPTPSDPSWSAKTKTIAPSPSRELGRMTGMPTDSTSPGDRYGALIDPSWKNPRENALSTFSVDVDNAAYSNIRRMIEEGRSIPSDAVRIEECINAFDYGYAPPTNDDAFAVYQTLRPCPWNEKHALLRIGIKGREVPAHQRPASNLVFLIDVSGSMQSADKLPLVKESLKVLLDRLDERDSVSYVVYAGSEGVVLPPTTLDLAGRARAVDALEKLTAGGSTNGGAGIQRAYQIAAEQFRKGGVNRVILCSDGDFNVGVTGTSQLVSLVKERAAANIYLSVLSFGTGNLNDEMLEAISRDGNGNYYYIDGIREARKVFLQKLSGTLVTIAKDVKLQLEFNPARVGSYRLIGYANRQLRDQDFKDDRVDAGDIGAGHEVTAFYEIVPTGVTSTVSDQALKYQPSAPEAVVAPQPAVHSDEWLTVKLRHKHPEGDISKLQEHALRGDIGGLQETDNDFRFAAAVAMFGMKLRQDKECQHVTWEQIRQLATQGLGDDADRAEFIDLLRRVRGN